MSNPAEKWAPNSLGCRFETPKNNFILALRNRSSKDLKWLKIRRWGRRKKKDDMNEMMSRHSVNKKHVLSQRRILWASSAVQCHFHPHKTPSHWPTRTGWRAAGASCWGRIITKKTSTSVGPGEGVWGLVFRRFWQRRWEVPFRRKTSEKSTDWWSHLKESCHHLSAAAAAAMGARMEPRAVAASSSISVFNRLMTHSIASRPWHTHKQRSWTSVTTFFFKYEL